MEQLANPIEEETGLPATLKIKFLDLVGVQQALKFLSVGVLNTLLDALLYFALTRWLGLADYKVLAKAISYGVGILNSFYWNKNWTFKNQAQATWRVFAVFVLVNLVSLMINAGMMYACLELLALPDALGWLTATGVVFAWNFLLSKFVVFNN